MDATALRQLGEQIKDATSSYDPAAIGPEAAKARTAVFAQAKQLPLSVADASDLAVLQSASIVGLDGTPLASMAADRKHSDA